MCIRDSGNVAFTLQPTAFESADIWVVLESKLHGFVYVDCEVRDAVVGNHYQVYIFGNAQITAERLDIIVDLDLRIEAVCLFGQFVEFQLEHFVFGDRSDIVTSLCIPVKRVLSLIHI